MAGNIVEGVKFSSYKWTVIMPLVLIAFDVLTGFIAACASKNVKSSIMRRGLAKKFGEIAAIALAQVLAVGFTVPAAFNYSCSVYICVMELISITENLENLGIKIPFLRKILAAVKEKLDKQEQEVDKNGNDDKS